MTTSEINRLKYDFEFNKRELTYRDHINYFKVSKINNSKELFWTYNPLNRTDIINYKSLTQKEKYFYQRVLLTKLPKIVDNYYGIQGIDKIKPSQLPMVLLEDKWLPRDNLSLQEEAQSIFGKKTSHIYYPINYLEKAIKITTTWHIYITGFNGQYNYFFEEYDPNNLFRACAERNLTLSVN
jgi:hypothetical protein